MENGDDLLRIFLSKRSLLNNESYENLPSSRKSSARTYRMGETRDVHLANGYVTLSDSEADKLIQYHNIARSRMSFEESQIDYMVRPSSDGSYKYISRSDRTTINETSYQININSIEKLNLVECNSTVTTDSVNSINSTKYQDHCDDGHFSIDSFNESYPKQIGNNRQKPKKRISPIDEISENSINSAKLKEYFAKKEKEKKSEEKEIQRIIIEAQRLSANRPASRKQSNYEFMRNSNGNISHNGQKVQQNNYILFYNEYFETSSAQGENQSENSVGQDSTSGSFSSSGRDYGTPSGLRRPSVNRSDNLGVDDLNMSTSSSSIPTCCCAKLFKSLFCRTKKFERKPSSGRSKQFNKSNEANFYGKKEK